MSYPVSLSLPALARNVFTSNKCILRMWALSRSGLWPVYPIVHKPLLISRKMLSISGSRQSFPWNLVVSIL